MAAVSRPPTVRRLFGDFSWRGAASSLNLSVVAAANDLTGNGSAPVDLLRTDRDAVFTHPDETGNNVALLTLKARRQVVSRMLVESVADHRRSHLDTFNGDAADADNDLERTEDGEPAFDGVNNRSRTRGHGGGATGQMTSTHPLAGRESHFIVGASVDAAATQFDFASELAYLTPDRGTIGTGIFDDDAYVDLHTGTVTGSAFLSETWSLTRSIAITGAARVNWTSLRLRDQIGVELDGDHTFARLNPSAGATYQARRWLNVYGSYAESSRVPSPVELTCADPQDPCRLPNAFVSDPPLEQIVARTWEAGARGTRGPVRWASAVFASTADDDIIFVSSGTLRGEGHFENIERTRRAGVEVSVDYEVAKRLSAFASYTVQRVQFGTDLRIASRLHPDAEDGELAVTAGDRVPGVPVHSAKGGITVAATSRLQLGASLQAQSGLVLRGDEANLLPESPGFARLDARARYRINGRVSVIGHVQNLLDAEYATFGVLGDPSLLGDSTDPRFFSPGEPRGAWAGVEVQF